MVDWCLLFTYDCDTYAGGISTGYRILTTSSRTGGGDNAGMFCFDWPPDTHAVWNVGACLMIVIVLVNQLAYLYL